MTNQVLRLLELNPSSLLRFLPTAHEYARLGEKLDPDYKLVQTSVNRFCVRKTEPNYLKVGNA